MRRFSEGLLGLQDSVRQAAGMAGQGAATSTIDLSCLLIGPDQSPLSYRA
jgi:hypothetical protein